jgi:hypothetical protein
MEFVWSDKDGRTRESFGSRDEAVKALRDEGRQNPDITNGWMLLTYSDDGEEIGEPEWAEDILGESSTSRLSFVIVGSGENVGLFVPVAEGEKFGKVASIRRGFRHRPSDAIHTRALPPGEKAAG